MNKKIKLLTALLMTMPLVACGNTSSTVNPSTTTPPTTSTTTPPVSSVTPPTSSTAPSTSTVPLPTTYSTHAEFMEAEDGTVMMVKGKATHVYSDTKGNACVYLQDGEGGYLAYSLPEGAKAEVGKSYKVVGAKTTYNGQRELKEIDVFEEITEAVATSTKDLSDASITLDDKSLTAYHNGVVTISGVLAQDPVTGAKAYSVSLSVGSQTMALRVDPSIAGSTAFAAISTLMNSLHKSQAITVKGILISFGYGKAWNPQIQIVSADDITVTPLTDAAWVDIAKTNVVLPYVATGDITLPTKYNDDIAITWASDKTDVVSAAGKVTKPANDTKVKMTATITKGTASATKDIEIYVLGTDISKQEVVAKTGFEDTSEPDQYGQSGLKGGYADGSITIDEMKWRLNSALIGGTEADHKNGRWCIRQKPSGATYTEEDYSDITFVDFWAAAYGTSAAGKVVLSVSTDGGTTWVEKGSYQLTNDLQQIRTYVNITGPARFKFEYKDTTGNLSLDDVSLVKVAAAA